MDICVIVFGGNVPRIAVDCPTAKHCLLFPRHVLPGYACKKDNIIGSGK